MATEILTTRAVAERFQVHPATVARWVHNRRIHPMQKTPGLRGQYLFTKAEVERFAATLDQPN